MVRRISVKGCGAWVNEKDGKRGMRKALRPCSDYGLKIRMLFLKMMIVEDINPFQI